MFPMVANRNERQPGGWFDPGKENCEMSQPESLKVSLIIAVYKDIEALGLILDALKNQTYKNFEVVVAEDSSSSEMKEFISGVEGIEVKHTRQDDKGIRKTRSINNAILASEGDYLIFIDGDCIPYSTFIESHVSLTESGYVVSGRRVNLGPRYSAMLRGKRLTPLQLETTYLLRFPLVAWDAIEKHAEAGIRFSTDSWYYKLVVKNKKRNVGLLGCNYSCFKNDMVSINGYDEGYPESSLGDDTDLEWRFKACGLKIKSAKNIANQFHLYHERSWRGDEGLARDMKKMRVNQENNRYFCEQGLDKH